MTTKNINVDSSIKEIKIKIDPGIEKIIINVKPMKEKSTKSQDNNSNIRVNKTTKSPKTTKQLPGPAKR